MTELQTLTGTIAMVRSNDFGEVSKFQSKDGGKMYFYK